MPLPLAPLLPWAVRLGLMTAAGYAVQRLVAARSHPGRTDQRAEDALDDLGEGLALHHPADRADAQQTNASARLRRVIRFRGAAYEIDASLLARWRVQRLK
jgi:hypothetical protein